VIALTSPYLWYTARAAGIVTLALFTCSMALGIMTATRVGGRPLPRFAVAEVHRRISLLACVFLAIHVASSVIDTYVRIGLVAVVVPFASHYKPLWVAMGSVSLDLVLAVTVTSLLRTRMRHGAWRAVHWLSYLAWPTALIHSVFIGSDLRFGWMDLFVAANVAVVLAAVAWRFWANPHPDGALTAVPERTVPPEQRRRARRGSPSSSVARGSVAAVPRSRSLPTQAPLATSRKKRS
jgi:sulfoxide reductase heme-binding subunit YedZ